MTAPRTVPMTHDMAQAIEHGARFLATLAAVERAHALADEQEVENILAGVDPIDVRLTANVLQALSFLWHAMPEVRGGTTGAQATTPLDSVVPLSPRVTAASSGGEQPSAPIIPLHNHSTKVPCA